jgi:hypothetical protein
MSLVIEVRHGCQWCHWNPHEKAHPYSIETSISAPEASKNQWHSQRSEYKA